MKLWLIESLVACAALTTKKARFGLPSLFARWKIKFPSKCGGGRVYKMNVKKNLEWLKFADMVLNDKDIHHCSTPYFRIRGHALTTLASL